MLLLSFDGNLHYIIYVINYLFNDKVLIQNKSSNINLLTYKLILKRIKNG